MQNLQRDVATRDDVGRAIDRAEATGGESRVDAIAIVDRDPDERAALRTRAIAARTAVRSVGFELAHAGGTRHRYSE